MTTEQTTQDDALLAVADLFDDPGDDDRRPWEPPGAWVPKPGDRVRIEFPTNAGECQMHAERNAADRLNRVVGMTGVVRATDDERYYGHPFDVQFDRAIVERIAISNLTYRTRRMVGGLFALGELVRLDQPTNDDGGER